MRICCALLAAVALFAGPRGGISEQVPPARTFRNGLDVLLIRIVEDSGDTGEGVIERVFRGREKPGPVPIRWDISVGPSSNTNVAAVQPGDRLIVAGGMAANQFFPQFVYRDSEAAQRDLSENLPAAERIDVVQGTAFLFLLSVPVLQLVFHVLYRRTRKRVHLLINLFLPVAALADYLFYESGIPAYMNIRIDLLLLIPVAALIALLWVIFAVRYWNARRDAPHPELH